MPPGTLPAQPLAHSIEKELMKTEYDADTAFLYPNTGEQERRFYALMLRSRGKKSLAICGFAGAVLPGIGIYTYPQQNGVLSRYVGITFRFKLV